MYYTYEDYDLCYFASGKTEVAKKTFNEMFDKKPEFNVTNLKSIFYSSIQKACKADVSINDKFTMHYLERK